MGPRKEDETNERLFDLLLEGAGVVCVEQVSRISSDRKLSSESIWFVSEGLVRRYALVGGRPVLTGLHGRGAVVCAAPCERDELLVAQADSRLVEFPWSSMSILARRRPEAAMTLMAGMSREQRCLRQRLLRQNRSTGAERLDSLLRLLAREVGSPCRHAERGWYDLDGLTQQELADLCGMARPHLTGLLRRLVSAGRLVRRRGRGLCVAAGELDEEEARVDQASIGA